MSQNRIGKDGFVTIAGVTLCITSWEATETAEMVETTNSCSGGNLEKDPSFTQLTGSVEAVFQKTGFGADPLGTSPFIRAGTEANLKLYPFGIAVGRFWEVTTAILNNVRISVTIKGEALYSFDFESTGVYTWN